jgi:LmbE family N-acetylglucosaminyl deacetylase
MILIPITQAHLSSFVRLQDWQRWSDMMKSQDKELFRCRRSCIHCFQDASMPSFIVDITDFVDDKMKAIRAYGSQFYDAASANRRRASAREVFWTNCNHA